MKLRHNPLCKPRIQMNETKFKNIIEEFVTENFTVTGCRECHETSNGKIVPEDYKGSYDHNIRTLKEKLCH